MAFVRLNTTIDLPVNTGFVLRPADEVEAYREVRKLPRTQDLSMLEHWLEVVAPIVNGNVAETIQVPVVTLLPYSPKLSKILL